MTEHAESDLVDVDRVDLSRPETFAQGPPFDFFARLRDVAPVHWSPSPEHEGGFWSLTRYADVERVIRDWQTFSSERRGILLRAILPLEMQRQIFSMMDPPEHDRQRGILSKAFTPRVIAERESDIRQIVTGLIDDVIETGTSDFVADIAAELPLTVTANMLGVPFEDRHKLFRWTNLMVDPDVPSTDLFAMMAELGEYLLGLIDERRKHATGDLLSRVIHAELDGERLTDEQVVLHFTQIMAGGSETTRNTLAGGVRTLLEHPDQWQKLIKDPRLVDGAVEEILRWHTPVMHAARTATRDVELCGVPVKEGELVVGWLISAHRDPSANPEPDRFDVSRPSVNHMAFGAGRHYCVGNSLAKLELRVALTEVLRRMPQLELAGDVVLKPSNTFHWMLRMPVSFPPGH